MQLSKHFTLEELTQSNTATRLGIDNTPNEEVKRNLQTLINDVLEPVRQRYGKPIIVSSGYRCELLNQKVGGAKTSLHKDGLACDFHSVSNTKADNKELFDLIVELATKYKIITFRTLINEYNYKWIHVDINGGNHTKRTNYITAVK